MNISGFSTSGTQSENGELLGKVSEVQRLADIDYLFIQTDKALVANELPKSFLIPNISRYILSVDIDSKTITVIDAKEILEASQKNIFPHRYSWS